MSPTKQDGLYNLRIHYIWTFFSSVLFLSPIITLFYQSYGMSISGILVLTATFTIFSTLLEIPTSTIGDTLPRTTILKRSVISLLISHVLYVLIPSIPVFFIAVFFAALGNALWSGTGHAKLQEDLELAEKEKEFGKVIGRLIALQSVGKLFTPIAIFFILQYLPLHGYQLLAGLDVITWGIASYFVFQFRKAKDVDTQKFESISKFVEEQKRTLQRGWKYLVTNTPITGLLIVMILGNDLFYLGRILLPNLVENGVEDFMTSIIVWCSVGAGILGNLLSHHLTKWIPWNSILRTTIGINVVLHFFASLWFDAPIIISMIFITISGTIGIYGPTWNHLLMEYSSIREKSTVRSIFLLILGVFEAGMLLISSFLSPQIFLPLLTSIMCISFLFTFKIPPERKVL